MQTGEVIVSSLADPTMQWFHEPADDGSFEMQDDDTTMILVPPSRKDYWRRTYYQPLLIKDDGPFFAKMLEYPMRDKGESTTYEQALYYYTVETTFDLVATAQFDQAGIMIRVDQSHWIKTGIEVVDRKPRLSCVVTNNDYSDWSTQAYQFAHILDDTTPVRVENVHVRVHCRGNSFVVEAKIDKEWQFIRIAHMELPSDQIRVGVFACCPISQSGGKATFSSFSIRRGSTFDHHA
jgi:regulation of enolase protein 1 (concanavalin A-like superfamily)